MIAIYNFATNVNSWKHLFEISASIASNLKKSKTLKKDNAGRSISNKYQDHIVWVIVCRDYRVVYIDDKFSKGVNLT